jgi:hypothetical protein
MMPARSGFRHCAVTIFRRVFYLALCSTPVHAQQRYLLEETTAANGKAAAFEAAQKDYCAAVLRGGAP